MTKKNRQIVITFFSVFVFLAVGLSLWMTLRFRQARLKISDRIEQIGEIDFSALQEEAPIDVIVSLGVLETTLEGVWFLHVSEKQQAVRMERLFAKWVQDGKWTPAEYEAWMKKFEQNSVWLGKEEAD